MWILRCSGEGKARKSRGGVRGGQPCLPVFDGQRLLRAELYCTPNLKGLGYCIQCHTLLGLVDWKRLVLATAKTTEQPPLRDACRGHLEPLAMPCSPHLPATTSRHDTRGSAKPSQLFAWRSAAHLELSRQAHRRTGGMTVGSNSILDESSKSTEKDRGNPTALRLLNAR
jgi:hypothetical protein